MFRVAENSSPVCRPPPSNLIVLSWLMPDYLTAEESLEYINAIQTHPFRPVPIANFEWQCIQVFRISIDPHIWNFNRVFQVNLLHDFPKYLPSQYGNFCNRDRTLLYKYHFRLPREVCRTSIIMPLNFALTHRHIFAFTEMAFLNFWRKINKISQNQLTTYNYIIEFSPRRPIRLVITSIIPVVHHFTKVLLAV